MSPAEIAQIRSELACSLGELSLALGVDVKTLLDWESGERFPTKRHADKLAALRKAGPSAIPRKTRAKAAPTGVALLADPRLWSIVRKLTAHPELLREVETLAERYDDPVTKG